MSKQTHEAVKANVTGITKQIKFVAAYTLLKDAVNRAGIDLSYNEPAALASIKDTQSGYGGRSRFVKALVSDANEVYYIYVAEDGLQLLNKFSPFSSCLHDSPFELCALDENLDGATFYGVHIPKSCRKQLIAAQNAGKFGAALAH